MTAAEQRKALRAVHLITGLALVAYVYLPAPAELREVVRFLILPVLVLTGVAMWQAPHLRRLRKTRSRRQSSYPVASPAGSARRDLGLT